MFVKSIDILFWVGEGGIKWFVGSAIDNLVQLFRLSVDTRTNQLKFSEANAHRAQMHSWRKVFRTPSSNTRDSKLQSALCP